MRVIFFGQRDAVMTEQIPDYGHLYALLRQVCTEGVTQDVNAGPFQSASLQQRAIRFQDRLPWCTIGLVKHEIARRNVDPAAKTIDHYRAQVRSYLRTMGLENGLIVFVTSGTIMPVRLAVKAA